MIRTIISDLGKVLLNFDHMKSCEKISKYSVLTPNEIYKKMFESGLERKYELGQISSDQFAMDAQRLLDLTLDKARIKKYWVEIFYPMDRMYDLFCYLKKSYRLILLSNTNKWHFEYCKDQFPVVGLFDEFVLSYQQGVRKPDPEIFRIALGLADAEPGQCLYVDDIQEYADVASNLGIHGVRFENINQFKSDLERLGVSCS